jgi:hypothetical protein
VPALAFDVYGFRFRVAGEWDEAVEALRRDFAWFEAEAAGPVELEVQLERRVPDYGRFGDLPASFVTERNVVYRTGTATVIDYLGRAVTVIDDDGHRAVVEGEDIRVVRRAAFDLLLSRVSGHLDASGLARLHGLGLVGRAGAVVVMLPSGGGKTTLALRALRAEGVGFLSEGSAVIDRRGFVSALPFPLWIRDNAPEAADLPLEHVRRFEGELSDPRLLEISAFEDRIVREPQPLVHLVLARRSLGVASSLDPARRRDAVPGLVRESVVGFGFFQGAEFLLRHGLRDLRQRAGPMATRALACRAGLKRAQIWRLTLGRDREGNWQALERLLR